MAPPRFVWNATLPVALSKAYRFPAKSPVSTRPPAVCVTPATTGAGVRNRHRTTPPSASTAVSQPRPVSADVGLKPVPLYIAPGTYSTGPDVNVPHQSTAPT